MQRIEIEAGRLFLDVGLDEVAGDEPLPAEHLVEHVRAGTAWVAVVGTRVVGYAIASVVDGEGHLDQVSVVPEFGRQGIGGALLTAVAAWSRGNGRHSLTLTTFRDVPWNGPYYARLGFVEVAADELGPELTAIRAREARLDALRPRTAMRLSLLD